MRRRTHQSKTRANDGRKRAVSSPSVDVVSVLFAYVVRIEETWRLWQKFLDDFARFEEWQATSEKTAALPNSSGVLYTVAKEELKKFEVLQKNHATYLNY